MATTDSDKLKKMFPPGVRTINQVLNKAGFKSWLVGGCVRDLLLACEPKDWDMATDALPESVLGIFKKTVPTGIEHGTVTVIIDRTPFEVTTLRGEGDYSDGRRPESVVFLDDIRQDLARRDFTINAIALDPHTAEIIDPFGGQTDLASRLIRAVGVPQERFSEDGLRVLRGARFAARFEFDVEPETLAAMGSEQSLGTLEKVSAERIHDECLGLMRAARPSLGFRLLHDAGIIARILPELAPLDAGAWATNLAAVDLCRNDPAVRLASVLWGLDHSIANGLLRRLKFSNGMRARVTSVLQFGPVVAQSETDRDRRRLVAQATREVSRDMVAVLTSRREACRSAGASYEPPPDNTMKDAIAAFADVIESSFPASTKELAIRGGDLIKHLDLKPGPAVGELLRRLWDDAMTDPSLNDADRLVERARKFCQEGGP